MALLDEQDPQNSSIVPFKSDGSSGAKLDPEPPSHGWFLCFWFLIFVALAHCMLLLKLRGKQEDAWAAGEVATPSRFERLLSSRFSAYPEYWPNVYQRPFLLAATVAMMAALGIFALSLMPFDDSWAHAYTVLALLTFIPLIAFAALLTPTKGKVG